MSKSRILIQREFEFSSFLFIEVYSPKFLYLMVDILVIGSPMKNI
jgi:hypothetical protein